MAPSETPSQPSEAPRRGRGGLFLPIALFACLAAAWSVFWVSAAGRAEAAVEDWLKREAAQGRVYACADKRVAGFPFRIELICEQPTARLPADGGTAQARAPRLILVAQAYDPRRVIADLIGPVELAAPDGTRVDLSFAVAQASARLNGERLDRMSVSLTAPRLVADGAEIGAAQALLLHLRRAPDGTEGAYDFAAKLDRGASPALDFLPLGEGPLSAELQAQARGLRDLKPRPIPERLRAFADAGGDLHVALARVARGDVAAEAKGDLNLDTEGRLGGALAVTARGLDDVLQNALGGGRKDVLSSLLGAGAAMIGSSAQLDGRPATAYRVTFKRGTASIGPVAVAQLPPLF